MNIEYEATFSPIDKDALRKKLREVGAILEKKEFLQKRKVFNLPTGHEISGGWLRVRDEQDKITLSLKVARPSVSIEDQKEIELRVNDFAGACELLKLTGCSEKAYQENKRERWRFDDVEITLDEWPYLEPFVEIEGASEQAVKAVAEKLGFDYAHAYFGPVTGLYVAKYGISEDRINNQTPIAVFDMDKNPFAD